MTTRIRWIVLLILSLTGSGVLTFLPGVTEKFTASKTTRAAATNSTVSDSSFSFDQAASKIPAGRAATLGSSSNAPWDILRSAAKNRRIQTANSASFAIPRWQEVLSRSAPKARELFDIGMWYLRRGGYTEARLAFQTLIRTYPGDQAEALAYWAIGISYCREGGDENLLLASDQFLNWLIFFPREKELEDLAEAAQTNVVLIALELMNSAPCDKEIITAAKISAQALAQFLKGYPDSREASAAQFHLAEIQWYLSSVERR